VFHGLILTGRKKTMRVVQNLQMQMGEVDVSKVRFDLRRFMHDFIGMVAPRWNRTEIERIRAGKSRRTPDHSPPTP